MTFSWTHHGFTLEDDCKKARQRVSHFPHFFDPGSKREIGGTIYQISDLKEEVRGAHPRALCFPRQWKHILDVANGACQMIWVWRCGCQWELINGPSALLIGFNAETLNQIKSMSFSLLFLY